MNVIKIYGGLGNQMFQYAFGKAMGQPVMYDYSWFSKPSDPPRPFGLKMFRTNVPFSPFVPGNKVVHESENQHYRFNPDFLKMENTNFFGYWQNMKYIAPLLSELREEFKVRPEYRTEEYDRLKTKIILSKDSIALHVRRGDYITIKGHLVVPLEYYKKALEQVEGQLFIFSDDIPWCKEQFENAIFVDTEYFLDFELMRLCKHKITTNSTFSWWAAMLGEQEGTIIAPARWREMEEQQIKVEEENLIPKHWIRL